MSTEDTGESKTQDAKLERYWQQAQEKLTAASEAEAKKRQEARAWYHRFLNETKAATKVCKEQLAAFKLAREAKDYESSLSFFKAAEASLERLSKAFFADQALHFSLSISYGWDIDKEQRNRENLEMEIRILETTWANELFEQGKREAAMHHVHVYNKLLALFKESRYFFYLEDMNKILERYDNNPHLKAIKGEIKRRLMMKWAEEKMIFGVISFAALCFLIMFTVLFPIVPLITITSLLSLITLAPFLIWMIGYVQGALSKMTFETMKIKDDDLTSSQLTSSCSEVSSTSAASLLPQTDQLGVGVTSSSTLNSSQEQDSATKVKQAGLQD